MLNLENGFAENWATSAIAVISAIAKFWTKKNLFISEIRYLFFKNYILGVIIICEIYEIYKNF